jgi:hypothetical protein
MIKQLLTILTLSVMTFAANAQDYALQFDSSIPQRVKYITIADDALEANLNGATDYTIEFWMYPTSSTFHNTVLLKRWNQFAVTLYKDTDFKFYFTQYGISNKYVNTVSNAFTINEWNHIVIICDSGANTIKLYNNGVDVTDDNDTAADVVLAAAPASSNLYLGYGGSGSYFDGYLDKIRIKNTVELISNLQKDINDAPYTTDVNTALLYNFNEGAGDITANEAGGTDLDAELECNVVPCAGGETFWVTLSSIAALAVEDSNLIDFSVYPNPVTAKIFTIKAQESIKNVQIFNVLGKSVKTVEVSERAIQLNIDVANLSKGIYFVKTETDAGIGTQKIIIQ